MSARSMFAQLLGSVLDKIEQGFFYWKFSSYDWACTKAYIERQWSALFALTFYVRNLTHIYHFHFNLFSAVFLFLACVIYPSGWDNDELQKICGPESGRYRTGACNIRWAYILAILGIFDAAILAVLAFFLAAKRAKIEVYSASGAVTKCK